MAKDVLIQVTIYDDETGAVYEQYIDNYSGEYGYEVARIFDHLGQKIAKKIDPSYE